MHKRIMLVFPDSKRRWGYATTELPEPSDVPYITMGGKPIDGYDYIICNDADVAQLLCKHGFNVEDTASICKKTYAGISFPTDLYDKIKLDADEQKRTMSDVVVSVLEKHYT